jgi:mono/diheme cytochrome c family protein
MARRSMIAGKRFKAALATLGMATLAVSFAAPQAADEEANVAENAAPELAGQAPELAAEAVDPTIESAGLSAEQVELARQVFNDWSCGACHELSDASANGHIGPSLDGDLALSKDFIVSRVTNGQGAMPGFGGQMTDEEIALVADYIMQTQQ